jgi:hypothetical protein
VQAAEVRHNQPGISALLLANGELDTAVLDLAAVLDGLVPDRFEIIVVGEASCTSEAIAELRGRAPRLPLRGATESAEPRYELIFLAARDGQFDVRELNHLLEAVERGADVAAGYRPRRTDPLVRHLQRWGCRVDVDCAFALLRRAVWQCLGASGPRGLSCADLSSRARRLGFHVIERPVSQRRPRIGVPDSPTGRAA